MMQPSFCFRIAGNTARMQYKNAVEVDLDQLVPALQFHVGPASLRHVDAGAVDQKVDPAVFGEDLVGSLVDVGFVADIELDRLGLAAFFGDVGDHSFEFFLAAARNHHRPAVGRQKFRPGLARSRCHHRSPRPRVSRYLTCKLSPLLSEGRFC